MMPKQHRTITVASVVASGFLLATSVQAKIRVGAMANMANGDGWTTVLTADDGVKHKKAKQEFKLNHKAFSYAWNAHGNNVDNGGQCSAVSTVDPQDEKVTVMTVIDDSANSGVRSYVILVAETTTCLTCLEKLEDQATVTPPLVHAP